MGFGLVGFGLMGFCLRHIEPALDYVLRIGTLLILDPRSLTAFSYFFQHTPISDAGRTLPVVLYPKSKVPTLESVEATVEEQMLSTSATKLQGKGK